MIKQNQHFIINQSNLLWPGNFNTSYQSYQAWYWDKWIKMKKKTKIRQYLFRSIRSSHRRCFIKKVFFEISQNLRENTCDRVSGQQLYLKRGSRAVFSCEFCEIFHNTFFTEHLLTTAPVASKLGQLHEKVILSDGFVASSLFESRIFMRKVP